MHSGYVPPLARDTSDLFGLMAPVYRPPLTGGGEPAGRDSLKTAAGYVRESKCGSDHCRGTTPTSVQWPLHREREPQEETGVPFEIGRWLRDPVEAP